jgi:menaquinone-dependent protoporphyrinogen oxidase
MHAIGVKFSQSVWCCHACPKAKGEAMMDVAIVYGTVEGQSRKIAEFSADTVRQMGHDVTVHDANSAEQVSFAGRDAVILVASVHQRRHPPRFEALIAAHHDELHACKTMFLSVSLNAAFPEGMEEAREYVTEMKMRTNFQPDTEKLIAGAVRVGEYDYFAMQVLRYVVLRDREHDADAGEHEFTDWDALAFELGRFLG